MSRYYLAYDFNLAILDSLPVGSVYIGSGDDLEQEGQPGPCAVSPLARAKGPVQNETDTGVLASDAGDTVPVRLPAAGGSWGSAAELGRSLELGPVRPACVPRAVPVA